jgi:ribose transport system substrate-binding protein
VTKALRFVALPAAAALLMVSATACGSSNSGKTGAQGNTPAANVQHAQATIDQLLAAPTITYNPGPLPGNPAGKHVVVVLPTTSKGQANEALFKAAAKALGITLDIRQVGTSAEAITNLYDQIAADPTVDGLYANSRDPSLWQPQFDKLAARGVPIVLGAITDNPAWMGKSVNVLSADRVVKTISQDAADWMVADSNGVGSAVVFTVPIQATLAKIANAYKDEVRTTCPGCKVDEVDVQSFASIGKDLPGTVVSYLQAHPDVKYVFMAFGDMMVGVPDALRAVGLKGIKLSSQSAGATNVQYLRDGTEAADFAYTHPLVDHVAMDALARGMLGGSMKAADDWMMPVQLLTPANIGSAAVNPDGSIAVQGLDAFFNKLWGKS